MCPNFSSTDAPGDLCAESTGMREETRSVFHLPRRNAYPLTGRDALLKSLRDSFLSGIVVQSISGPAGSGRTAVAIEYATRYRDDYDVVIWARAETPEILVTDFAKIAGILDLPERDSPYMSIAVGAVLTWLASHTGWLLVLDDAEEPLMARAYATFSDKGHVLLTTQNGATDDFALRRELELLDEAQSIELIRREAGVSAEVAGRVAPAAKGLPLALMLIARQLLLQVDQSEPASVIPRRGLPSEVWIPCRRTFQWLELTARPVADLLRLASFLHHEAIPIEVFEDGALTRAELEQILQEGERTGLLAFQPAEGTVSLPRLVKRSIGQLMEPSMARYWAERAVMAVESVFPDGAPGTWEDCDRLLPQAIELDSVIAREHLAIPAAGLLLGAVAFYLDQRGQVGAAEPLYQHALAIEEQRLGAEHPDLVTLLNNLAVIHETQGRYPEAEILLERALAIREGHLPPGDPSIHKSLANLTRLYQITGNFAAAESIARRSLVMLEETCGCENPAIVPALENLSFLYEAQSRFEQAETLCERALEIRERVFGPDHPETAKSLEALAHLYISQTRYLGATLFHERALAIRLRVLGEDHPETALSLATLADLQATQGRSDEAVRLYERAYASSLRSLGPVHPQTIKVRFNFDSFLCRVGR